MLEIIALIFLCRKNGNLALQKGLQPGAWKFYTVLAWLAAEIIGISLAVTMFDQTNLAALMLTGLLCAFGGYLVIRAILEKKPDFVEEDINQIGVDDLAPKK